MVTKNGDSVYEGDFHDGLPHGHIKATFATGSTYEGLFEFGKRQGWGKEYYGSTGDRYEGEFWQDERHGWGTFNWLIGDRYEGDFVQGLSHGRGTSYYHNGDKHEG